MFYFRRGIQMEEDSQNLISEELNEGESVETTDSKSETISQSEDEVIDSLSTSSKKGKRLILGIVSGLIVVIVIAFGIYSFLNHPLRLFELAIADQDLDQAELIYNESIKGNLDYEPEIEEEALGQIELIQTKYINEEISYDEALTFLIFYEGIDVVRTDAIKVKSHLKTIKVSRDYYQSALEALEKDNLGDAITYFLKVDSEDEVNYKEARSQINELKEPYLAKILSEVETLAASNEYHAAVTKLDNALKLFPNENTLSDKKTEIDSLLVAYEEAEEKKKIETYKAEQKLTVTKAYSEDSFIYNLGYAIVKNHTNEVVKNFMVGILMFDDYGYPVNNTYTIYGEENLLRGESDTPNIQPGATFGSNYYWYIEDNATKIKACVIEAEFYDGTTWTNPYFEYWYEAEKDRY